MSSSKPSILWRLLHALLVVTGSGALTLACFLLLPLIQAIDDAQEGDLLVRTVQGAQIPPPPPPPDEPEEEEEEEQEEPPPELEEAPPLDLSQLEMALNPSFDEGWGGADVALRLSTLPSGREQVDELFSMTDNAQEPRPIYQPSPVFDARMRKLAPASVSVLFLVDESGRVKNAIVQSPPNPLFDRAVLAALQQWRFEPGRRNGKPVPRPMRQPFTFPGE